ncbi:hypothetical protein DYB37_011140 [Aphanomyces astaci]|uniref:Uncharacterized protein n=1 Tax=Aphanomyces astaci TaxID=112090 RepID=A0A3R7C498_APHAT|nr:hypothetical protein DYB35_009127 [Aphanomyces astaci]RHZ32953.1 hypothetical protein DYB37_011140 [Aphanomyces astaci]
MTTHPVTSKNATKVPQQNQSPEEAETSLLPGYVEAATGIPKSNLGRWDNQATKPLAVDGTSKRFNLDGAGRPEQMPDTAALAAFVRKLRDAERTETCTHLVNYHKSYHRAWLDCYLANKNCGYQSLLKLI